MQLVNQSITPYPEINSLLVSTSERLDRIFDNKLIGLYLFGSLTYGDFNEKSSDIDLVTILKTPATTEELEQLRELHSQIETECPKWAKRFENSYTPISMLTSKLPPLEPRPYFGEGTFYPEATYGNEWIINLYLLYQYGIPIVGPDFKTLIPAVDMVEVQKASAKDLFSEWEPKLKNPEWLDNSHYQSYLVLNLCRILYTVLTADARSKKVASSWVKKEYPEWESLIQTAEDWHYGIQMDKKEETLDFLRFVIDRVKASSVLT